MRRFVIAATLGLGLLSGAAGAAPFRDGPVPPRAAPFAEAQYRPHDDRPRYAPPPRPHWHRHAPPPRHWHRPPPRHGWYR